MIGPLLSFDNDSFNAWDDFFTIACSPLQKYTFPKYWPECVKSCKNCLPDAPLHTGLLPVVPPNSIPIGGFGEFVCDDRSLGVMEVSYGTMYNFHDPTDIFVNPSFLPFCTQKAP